MKFYVTETLAIASVTYCTAKLLLIFGFDWYIFKDNIYIVGNNWMLVPLKCLNNFVNFVNWKVWKITIPASVKCCSTIITIQFSVFTPMHTASGLLYVVYTLENRLYSPANLPVWSSKIRILNIFKFLNLCYRLHVQDLNNSFFKCYIFIALERLFVRFTKFTQDL